MLIKILRYLKCLIIGCEESSPKEKELISVIESQEKKLEEIDNEKNSDSDIVDHFNNN
jgi:hypothetical protein